MANNYCQASQLLALDQKGIEWFHKNLETAQVFFNASAKKWEEFDKDNPAHVVEEDNCVEVPKWRLPQVSNVDHEDIFDFRYCGFSYEIEEDDIWFYDNEYLDIEAVAQIVQLFFEETGSDDCFTIEAAYTCSKPRPGEFGGAAVFVTADSIEYMTTSDWCRMKEAEHRKKEPLKKE